MEPFIERSLAAIEEKLTEGIDIREPADCSRFSPYHFQRLFRAYAGSSVMAYVKKRRLSLAGRELCETGHTVADIAFKYGYGAHESFTRAFKAYHGVTPAECRKYRFTKPLKPPSLRMNTGRLPNAPGRRLPDQASGPQRWAVPSCSLPAKSAGGRAPPLINGGARCKIEASGALAPDVREESACC